MPDLCLSQLCRTKFLCMFEVTNATTPGGKKLPPWSFVSRHTDREKLPLLTGDYKPDAVAIEAVWYDPGNNPHLVLVKQFRAPVGLPIIELPAGLVDKNEIALNAAIRETLEETGLKLTIDSTKNMNCGFSSAGCTDEFIGIVTGICEGIPSNIFQESTEDIQVILADVDECQAILDTHKLCDIRASFAIRLFIEKFGTN